jgi:hypothetical protein
LISSLWVPSPQARPNIHKRIRTSIREQGRRFKRRETSKETVVSMSPQEELDSNRNHHLRISTSLKLNYLQNPSFLSNSKVMPHS